MDSTRSIPQSDEELWAKLKEGKKESLRTLFLRYYDSLFSDGLSVCSTEELEEIDEFKYNALVYLANEVISTFANGVYYPYMELAAKRLVNSGKWTGPRIWASGPYFGTARPALLITRSILMALLSLQFSLPRLKTVSIIGRTNDHYLQITRGSRFRPAKSRRPVSLWTVFTRQ